jgi:hypothetical protein
MSPRRNLKTTGRWHKKKAVEHKRLSVQEIPNTVSKKFVPNTLKSREQQEEKLIRARQACLKKITNAYQETVIIPNATRIETNDILKTNKKQKKLAYKRTYIRDGKKVQWENKGN